MAEVNSTISNLVSLYSGALSSLPSWGQAFVNLFLILAVILLYLLFVRGFYASISKKDVLGLNLNQYNKTQLPFANLVNKSLLYLAEYIIIIPFVVFFWFSILAFFLLILTDISVTNILLVSAVVVIAARITSYFKKSLSENIAKLLPFNLLAIALLTAGFFKFDVILGHFQAVPSLVGQIIIYLVFIVAFEVLMRVFDFIISLFDISFEEKAKEEQAVNTPAPVVIAPQTDQPKIPQGSSLTPK